MIALADENEHRRLGRLRALLSLPRRHGALELRCDRLERQVADLYDQVRAVREIALGIGPQLDRLNEQVPDIYLRLGELRNDLGPIENRIRSHVDNRVGEQAARLDLLTSKVHDVRDDLRDVFGRGLAELSSALVELRRQLEEIGQLAGETNEQLQELPLPQLEDAVAATQLLFEARVDADIEATAALGRLWADSSARLERVERQLGLDAGAHSGELPAAAGERGGDPSAEPPAAQAR